MIIAQQLLRSNRAEYLLYMWQVEDILRVHHCDIEQLRNNYLSQFQLSDVQQQEMDNWYANLCQMMIEEGKKEKGHLQINQNVLEGLADIHRQVINCSKYPFYKELYYKILPYLVELRSKQENKKEGNIVNELELCFELLYGVMLLKHQQKEIFSETAAAVKDISTFLGQLSDYWFADKEGKLTLE